jgi:teichuronic acid biosynthesis glycosyltransferase TuaG
MKREILKKGKLFANFSTKEDYYLWLKIANTGEIFHYINLPLSYWKRTPNSLSSSLIQKLIDSYKVYFHFEKSFFISIYRTLILSLNFIIKKKNDN